MIPHVFISWDAMYPSPLLARRKRAEGCGHAGNASPTAARSRRAIPSSGSRKNGCSFCVNRGEALRARATASGGFAAGWWRPGSRRGGRSPVAGWVLAQFVELDLRRRPIGDYASSSGLRVVAWVLLNRAAGPDAKPQYVVAGTLVPAAASNAISPRCAFIPGTKSGTVTRAAYIENDLCGSLCPFGRVRSISNGRGIQLSGSRSQGGAERTYRMRDDLRAARCEAAGSSRH